MTKTDSINCLRLMEPPLAAFNSSAFKLQIQSKKLPSGKCQVKFYARRPTREKIYGYVLVDAKSTLKEVVDGIYGRLDKIKNKEHYHHIHLYSIKKTKQNNADFIIFGP